jgi:hypothetical protein
MRELFQLPEVQGLWSWHHRLRIWVIRGSVFATLPWMLDLWCSRRTVFVEIESSRWIFSSAITCTAVVVWIFETVLLNVRRSLSVNVDYRPLFLFADVVFLWFTYADITLETVGLDTPNNTAIFIIDAPAKRAPTICPLSKSDKSPIFRFFHTDCYWTQLLVYWHEHYKW